jgi:hypothetical protein
MKLLVQTPSRLGCPNGVRGAMYAGERAPAGVAACPKPAGAQHKEKATSVIVNRPCVTVVSVVRA